VKTIGGIVPVDSWERRWVLTNILRTRIVGTDLERLVSGVWPALPDAPHEVEVFTHGPVTPESAELVREMAGRISVRLRQRDRDSVQYEFPHDMS
jgi:hypothetical protein